MSFISIDDQSVTKAEPYISEALSLMSSLSTARSPQDASNIISELGILAGRSEVMASSKASLIVNGIISTGQRIFAYLTTEEAQHIATEASYKYELDAKNDKLASNLASKGILSDQELAYIKTIKPESMRVVTQLDDNGNDLGSTEIKGQQLRDSYAILAAYENQDKLDEDARREYNRLLYGAGKENGPTTPQDIERGEERLKQAVRDVEGDASARAKEKGNEQDARNAGQRAKEDIAAIDAAVDRERERIELERKRDKMKEDGTWTVGMENATQPILEGAKRAEAAAEDKAKESISRSRRARMAALMGDAPATTQERETVATQSEPQPHVEPATNATSKEEQSELDQAILQELSKKELGRLPVVAAIPKSVSEQQGKYM